MKEMILMELKNMEKANNVKVLFAVESGSRAWGFASPDSDYDVRFIYIRPQNEYLKLNKTKDVIEHMLNRTLDINGWDLEKALKLLFASNPTFFEWLNSSIVYVKTPTYEKLNEISKQFFSIRACVNHYHSMAVSNYETYIKNKSLVRFKKYFYVIRPILAALYVLNHESVPPVFFEELVEEMLDQEMKATVKNLIERKISALESKEIPPIESLNTYIITQLEYLASICRVLPKENHSYDSLNEFFIEELSKAW